MKSEWIVKVCGIFPNFVTMHLMDAEILQSEPVDIDCHLYSQAAMVAINVSMNLCFVCLLVLPETTEKDTSITFVPRASVHHQSVRIPCAAGFCSAALNPEKETDCISSVV